MIKIESTILNRHSSIEMKLSLKNVLKTLRRWRARHNSRQHLATLDDRMLSDIGISRADALTELNKPFWEE